MSSASDFPPLFPVILSGGAGTRLWPVSRELHPKPFIRMPDGESLLQKAYRRALNLPGVREAITVTNRDFLWKTKDELESVVSGQVAHRFILEPAGRNTAPAIAAAIAELAEAHGNGAVALVLPADHLIADEDGFAAAVAQAVALAQEGKLVVFGIRPTGAETGYGYIEADGSRVVRFVEKPDAQQAGRYVASGKHLWNAGMFCFRADLLLAELARHAPDVLTPARACLSVSRRTEGNIRRLSLMPVRFRHCRPYRSITR